MNPRIPNKRNQALTRLDVLVAVLVTMLIFALLAAILVSMLAAAKKRASRISCISNLKQVNIAFRIWEGDNGNLYPMGVSSSIGGGRELIATGNVAGCFRIISNELSTTKILVCPQDSNRTSATNFDDLNSSHISYFLGADVTNESNPNLILVGDDNLEPNGYPVKSGLLNIPTNAPVTWAPGRHNYGGNLGFSDGSVAEVGDFGLQRALQKTGLATNRLAIP